MDENKYISDDEARRAITEIGRRMYIKNFIAGYDGNITCKVADDTIIATPSGVSKGFLAEDSLIKMRLDGTVIAGQGKPSSEIRMHLRVYQENPEVMAVVHAHPPAATAFAVARRPLDMPVYPAAIVNLGPVPCVPYQTPGSQAVADSIAPYVPNHKAVLLANHGAVTWAGSPAEAFTLMEILEHYATILLYTEMSTLEACPLSKSQMEDLTVGRGKAGTDDE